MAVATDRLTGIAGLALGFGVALPLAAGICGTLLPALGWFPALGARDVSAAPMQMFLATPGVAGAIMLSLGTGLVATFLSFIASFILVVTLSSFAPMHRLRGIMGPLILSLIHI